MFSLAIHDYEIPSDSKPSSRTCCCATALPKWWTLARLLLFWVKSKRTFGKGPKILSASACIVYKDASPLRGYQAPPRLRSRRKRDL